MAFALTRRDLVLGAAVTALLPPPVAAQSPAFPRKVAHAFGETLIAEKPKRVATIGFGDEASFLALGCKPAAIVYSGMFESGMTPWCELRFGAQKPAFLDGSITDFEAVARLEPGLIAGIFSQMDAMAYERLSRIAPTVAYRSGPWRAGWREQLDLTGEILGEELQAQALRSETEALLRSFGSTYPGLKGKSFTFGSFFAGSSRIIIYLPGETRVDWMVETGMKPSPGVLLLADRHPGQVAADLSLETLEEVNADLLVMWYEPGARAALESHVLFRMFEPVRRGRYFALDDPVEIWAASWPNVLAIPHAFPRFLPRMEAAANAETY